MLRNNSETSWLKRRGPAVMAIAGLHVAVIAALLHMGVIHADVSPELVPIKVAFLNEKTPEPPRPETPRVDPVPVVTIPLVLVDIPVDVPPPPTAITVASMPPQPPSSPAPSQESDDTPVALDSVDYLYQEPLRYPPQAKRARAQGVVYLRVIIDRDGHPSEVRVHRSSGHQALDGAACDAVQKFRFRPYRENGVAHNAQVIVPIQFSLTDGHMKARKDDQRDGRDDDDGPRGGRDDRHRGPGGERPSPT
jgi:protein TonB